MKRMFKQDSLVVEGRFVWVSVGMLAVSISLLLRLWYLQVYQGEYYQRVSERNRVRRIEIPAPRGIIYDRHGEIVLGNRPFYDLVYIPQYVRERDVTFQILSRLLHQPVEVFEKRIRLARGRPKFLPILLKRNLSLHEVSTIESNKVFLPGIEVRVVPRRDYKTNTPPHLVGYLREIDPEALKDANAVVGDNNSYLPGDLVGKQGLEARWEKYLRGERGYRLVQVDAYGRQASQVDTDIPYPLVPAKPGADLELTIDWALQNTVREAFSGKNGAVIVLDPRNGEILADLSEPGYDPAQMQAGLSVEEWRALTSSPLKPFLDKTTGGEFPPGSVYKPIVAMAALMEGVVNAQSTHYCPGYFTLGGQVFACHDRKGHGTVDLKLALMKSCDVYFYHLGVELGVDRIAKYAKAFGLGERLGVDLNMERPGLVPTAAWKMATHKHAWTGGDTPNIAIGQGYNLLTPMQVASFYAAIANGGKVWRPHLVRRVTNHVGETIVEVKPELIRDAKIVSPEVFDLIRNALKAVVMDPKGTGTKAQVAGHDVAGKTGSVQVVSLRKNRNQADVSIKWKEHALFAAFSPVDKPEIAIAIISQNDAVGGGGRSAAPVAGKIIAKYWELQDQRGHGGLLSKARTRPGMKETE